MNVFELFKESYGVGVVASKKQAKDPRYSHSLTKDVRPDTPKKNAKALMLASKNLNEAPGDAISDENLANILKLIAGLESGGKNIKNQTGSEAFGVYQFVPDTFERVKAKLDDSHPYKNVSWEDFKKNTDIQDSYAKAGMLDNVRYLNNKKIPVNVETIYNAHHFGPFVASLMHKNPDRTLKDIYEKNKNIKGMPSWDTIKEQNPYLDDDSTGATTVAYHKQRAEDPDMKDFYDNAGVNVAGLYNQDEVDLPDEAPVVATTPVKEPVATNKKGKVVKAEGLPQGYEIRRVSGRDYRLYGPNGEEISRNTGRANQVSGLLKRAQKDATEKPEAEKNAGLIDTDGDGVGDQDWDEFGLKGEPETKKSAKKELEIDPVSITVNDTRSKIDKLRDASKDMSLSDDERTKAQAELRKERDALQNKMEELRKDPDKNRLELNRLAGVYNANFGDTQVDATPIGSSAEEGFRKGTEVRRDDIISPAKLDLLGADIKQQAQAAKERGEEELAKQIDAKAEEVLDQAEKARMNGIQYIDTGGEEPAPIEQQVEKAIEKVIQAEPEVQGASGFRVDPNSERAELDRKTAEADREKRKGSTSYSSDIDSQGGAVKQGSGYTQGGVQKKQAQGYSNDVTSQGGEVKQGSGYGQGDVTVSTTRKEDPYPNPGYEGEELRIYNQLSDSQKAKIYSDFEKKKKNQAEYNKNANVRGGPPAKDPDSLKPRSLLDIKHQQVLTSIEGGTQLVDPAKAKEVSKILGMPTLTQDQKKARDEALNAIRFKAPSMDQIQQGMAPIVDKSINKDAEPEVDTTPVKAKVPPANTSDPESAIGKAVQPGTNLGKDNASQQAQDAQAKKAERDAKLAQQQAQQAQQKAEQEQKAAQQKAEQEQKAAERKAKQEQQKAEREARRQKSLSQGGTSGRNFNTNTYKPKSAIGQATVK